MQYSAIIPAHNEADRIAGALQSATSQSLPPSEIIVVDDGSTDRTPEIARTFPGVTVIRHHHCRGLAQARNTGLDAATSDWVALLDADDCWDSEKIKLQAELARSPDVGLVYCGIRFSMPDQQYVVQHASLFPSQRQLRRTLLLKNCITGSGSAVIFRRNLLERSGGFDTTLKMSEDRDMWIRLAQLTTFAAVPAPLVTIYKRHDSLGGDPDKMFQAGWVVLEKHDKLFRRFWDGKLLKHRAKSELFLRRAIGHMMLGNMTLARKYYARAAAMWPFQLKSIVPLAKICAGYLDSTSSR